VPMRAAAASGRGRAQEGVVKRLSRTVLTALILASPWVSPPDRAEDVTAAEGEAEDERERDAAFVEYVAVQDSSLPTSNTIATKLSVPLQLTPANVGTVGEALLYEQDAEVLGDALRNVSGLNIQNGSGVHDFFTIRGFDSVSSSLVMTDGAEEPGVSYYQMYNVRGVEVFKGPAGFLYGKNPLAGAVNIVRKQPLRGDFAVFRGSAGSFATREGAVDWNRSSEERDLSFRLNGLWQASDRYRDDKTSEHVAVNPGLTLWLGERGKLNLNFEYVEAEYSPDNGLPLVGSAIPNVPRRRSYQSLGDYSDQTLGRFQVDYETRLRNGVRLRNKAYYRGIDWKSEGTLLQSTVPANPMTPWLAPGEVQVVRDLGVLDDRQEYLGNQLEVVLERSGGLVEHELLVGVELVHESDEYTFRLDQLDDVELVSLETTAVDLGAPPLAPSIGDVTNQVIAPYAIDRMKFSPAVELVLGVRYDHIDVDGDVAPLGYPAPASFSRDDSEVSPMAGLVVAPGATLSIYANAAESYAPPSTRLVDEVDPASREPERGRQVEVGVKKLFRAGKVRTTLAVYELTRDRIAIADPNGFTQQSGDQRSRGVELEIAAEPRPRLRTFLSYAYTDAELTDFTRYDPLTMTAEDLSGNTPIMAPAHLVNLWVSQSFGGGFGLSGGARFVDEQYISEDNEFALDRALILDAAVFYDLDAWRFKLNLKNITDEEYETRGIASAASVIPADPFAVYAGVELRLR
jgi:TonB-dependent siderophore receptor